MPERYPLFRPLVPFFPRGDRARGLAELATARDQGRFARAEAAWLLAQLHYQFERDPAGSLDHVRWLREKIEDDPSNPTRIVTVRGVGYRFEG